MRMIGVWALGVCSVMFLATDCLAASIEPVQGQLSVNQGQGFAPVNSRIDAKVGDSVVVSPDGSAAVVYDDGCSVAVQPGAVVTIAPLSPCAAGSYDQGTGTGDQGGNPFSSPGGLVMGTVVLGVAGFVGYEASQSGKNTGVSSP